MKLVHQMLLFVATLSFTQHSQHVEGQLMNSGIVASVRKLIKIVLNATPQWSSDPSEYNDTTYSPMAETPQYVVPTYFPISSEDRPIQQQEVSTLPPDSVNDTVQDVPTNRRLIDAPLINKCEDGYKAVNGRCRKAFGRRRRRR